MLDVDIKTIRNWERSKSPIPYAAFRLMRMAGGYSILGDGWEGWAVWQDKLYSPSGQSFAPYELNYVGNYIQMARIFINDKNTKKAVSTAATATRTTNVHVAAAIGNHEKLDSEMVYREISQKDIKTNNNVVVYVDFNRKKGGNAVNSFCETIEKF